MEAITKPNSTPADTERPFVHERVHAIGFMVSNRDCAELHSRDCRGGLYSPLRL